MVCRKLLITCPISRVPTSVTVSVFSCVDTASTALHTDYTTPPTLPLFSVGILEEKTLLLDWVW